MGNPGEVRGETELKKKRRLNLGEDRGGTQR